MSGLLDLLLATIAPQPAASSAPAVPTLLNDAEAATATSITSGSISPASNSLLIALVGARDGNSVADGSLSTTLSNVGAWTLYSEQEGIGPYRKVMIWVAVVTGAPGTGTITWTGGEEIAEMAMGVFQVASGFDAATPVAQSKTGKQTTGTAFAIVLDASPGADSLLFGAVFNEFNGPITPGSDWTELLERYAIGTTDTVQAQHWREPSDGTCDWTLDSGDTAGVVIEIRAG